MRVVLETQQLIGGSAAAVGLRVSPAIKQISAFTGAAAGSAGSFLCCGAVVDDPDLIKGGHAEDDLVEFGIVGNRVRMKDIARETKASCVAVDVDSFGTRCGISVVLQSGLDVLNEVVPEMPFPDNSRIVWRLRLELDQHVGPDSAGWYRGGRRPTARVSSAVLLSQAIARMFPLGRTATSW